MSVRLLLITAALIATLACVGGPVAVAMPAESFLPSPELQDQVIQNKGNIVTTISNWGAIGGRREYGYPSGEWPKGSGHNYIGEMKYWMGATRVVSQDTLLANTEDDFAPIASLISGTESYQIRLSTDTTRFDYDPSDTVGAGVGRPANGWRVWNPETQLWDYNRVWDSQTKTMVPGGAASLQESYYRFDDAELGTPLLGLEMTQTVYQWNYAYNQDYLFVVLEITNGSEYDYTDFAFGLYCDFDIGGPDGTGENGRLGDLVKMDSSLNLAWTYDADGYDPGWGPSVKTGIMGTRYIETPDNIGMTAFRTGHWEEVPSQDPQRYAFIAARSFDSPLRPGDQYYLQCTSGIDLRKGKTIRIGFALIAGYDEADFLRKAQMAQAVYNNHFLGPEPPKPSQLTVLPSDKQARLSWNRNSEKSVDPMSNSLDFAGYKVYRSDDRGATWGTLERHADGSIGPDYVPLAIWRIDSLSEPIPHTYVDTTLTNGFEYWYSVVAFDKGDTAAGVGTLQTAYGTPGGDINAVSVIPRTNPAGYYELQKTLVHTFSGAGQRSDGNLAAQLFDPAQLTGQEYEVGFAETPLATTWHVVNKTTGDTLAKDLTDQTGAVTMAPLVDGIRLLLTNGERLPARYAQVTFASGSDTTLHLGRSYGPTADVFGLPLGGDIHFRSTYQIRFTASGSEGYSIFDDVTPIQLPFEIWNTTTNEQVIAEIYHQDAENPGWDPRNRDYVVVVNYPYDGLAHPEAFPYYDSWFFRFADSDTNYQVGDIFQIDGAPMNGSGDKFIFRSPGVNHSDAAAELDKIRAVPNPYIARASWETVEGERRMEFIHLPERAIVRIYSLSGDLVQTLQNESSGTLVWNMLSNDGQGIAPGLYYYNVDSSVGTRVGKFAVIK
jgi:hypothetical protein